MNKYSINLTNIERLQQLEIQADSRAEAVEKAKEMFEAGMISVVSNEVMVNGVYKVVEGK